VRLGLSGVGAGELMSMFSSCSPQGKRPSICLWSLGFRAF
jgi:hypothetical protein